MDKRYQVFVSSTYADLKEERQKIIQALMEMDCIPAGMELFPAVDEDQFAFIKRVIDDCDYYLLVIGGRYGSLTSAGISYTEQEYDYAVSKDIKVVAFLHEKPEEIPFGRSEQEPELRKLLTDFRAKVSTGRLVRHWNHASELAGLVALSLQKTIKTYPAKGWVRADRVASEDLLSEINEVRKVNSELEQELALIRQSTSEKQVLNLADIDEMITLNGNHHYQARSGYRWSTDISWRDIFSAVSPYLIEHPIASTVKSVITKLAFEKSSSHGNSATLDDQDFRTVGLQLDALGLVSIKHLKTTTGSYGLFWFPTPQGHQLMLELRTVKSSRSISSR